SELRTSRAAQREKEIVMVVPSKRIGPLVLRLLPALALLACPRIGGAAGTWSVISLPQQPGEVLSPIALALDTAGSLYVADGGSGGSGRIEKRDAHGNWSVIASHGTALGQVGGPSALAVDAA